jgi:hypothetical protein
MATKASKISQVYILCIFSLFLFLSKAAGLQNIYREITIIYGLGQQTLKMANDVHNVTGAVKGNWYRWFKGLRQIHAN